MTRIHPTAIVDPKAELGEDVWVGPYAIINPEVKIGRKTKIGSSVLLDSGTIIGENCEVCHKAVLGTPPQDLKYGGEKTYLKIGDNTIIREYASLNRGTKWRGETKVGKNCFIMMYAHIAHDCLLGDNVILANSVNLAGHIEIGDYAIVGGIVPVHQFVRIGEHSIVGGGFRIQKDVCPYMMVAGYPLRTVGINLVGLKRKGFSEKSIKLLKEVYKILFRSNLNTSQALEKIKKELEIIPEVKTILDFISSSQRGIIK